jgi:hypothetical protein
VTSDLVVPTFTTNVKVGQPPLFDGLHHPRWISLFRFADQEMNVIGHGDVADDHEVITLANFFEHSQK